MWDHGMFCWNEYLTKDGEKAKNFYASTLGWEFEEMKVGDFVDQGEQIGTYWLVRKSGKLVGGLFELKHADLGHIPDHWMAFVSVDDVTASLKSATDNGGTVIRNELDVPDVGRFGIVKDSCGAVFGMITPSISPDQLK